MRKNPKEQKEYGTLIKMPFHVFYSRNALKKTGWLCLSKARDGKYRIFARAYIDPDTFKKYKKGEPLCATFIFPNRMLTEIVRLKVMLDDPEDNEVLRRVEKRLLFSLTSKLGFREFSRLRNEVPFPYSATTRQFVWSQEGKRRLNQAEQKRVEKIRERQKIEKKNRENARKFVVEG